MRAEASRNGGEQGHCQQGADDCDPDPEHRRHGHRSAVTHGGVEADASRDADGGTREPGYLVSTTVAQAMKTALTAARMTSATVRTSITWLTGSADGPSATAAAL